MSTPGLHSYIRHYEIDGKDFKATNGGRMWSRAPILFDHFVSQTALTTGLSWVDTETGTGTSHAAWAPSTTVAGGALVGVAGATSLNTHELAGKSVIWNPSTMSAGNTPLFMECRAKFVGSTTAADGAFFVGWSDAVTVPTGGTPYVVSLTSTLTNSYNAAEGAYIGYSSIPTSGALHNASGNNSLGLFTTTTTTGSVAVTSPAQVKDSAYHVYRVEIDASGNVVGYVDDVVIGSVGAGIVANTAMTPYICVEGLNSHANTGTIDYIAVGGGVV